MVDRKITLEVFYSPSCPYCPLAINVVRDVASELKDDIKIHVQEINTWDPKGQARALQYGIYAVPSIVINGKLSIVGVPDKEKLRRAILSEVKESQK